MKKINGVVHPGFRFGISLPSPESILGKVSHLVSRAEDAISGAASSVGGVLDTACKEGGFWMTGAGGLAAMGGESLEGGTPGEKIAGTAIKGLGKAFGGVGIVIGMAQKSGAC